MMVSQENNPPGEPSGKTYRCGEYLVATPEVGRGLMTLPTPPSLTLFNHGGQVCSRADFPTTPVAQQPE